MANQSDYQSSTADWNRLHNYARRVSKETRRPREGPISYTKTEYRNVACQTTREYGPFGLFKKTEAKTEQRPISTSIEVIGPHWILDKRHHHIERNTRTQSGKQQETTHAQISFVLLPDGALRVVTLCEEEFTYTSQGKT